ncbi:MAG: hypothetical protein J6D44_04045 [Pseudomonas sp.]|nr:hypothetical protein [Pseudomonas sp.]
MDNLRWGGSIAILAGTTTALFTCKSTVGNRLNLGEALTADLEDGTRVMPVFNGLINPDISSSRLTGTVLEAQAAFSILPQEDRRKLPDLPPAMLFPVGADNREIILQRPNWATSPTVNHSWDFNVSDTYVNGPVVPINGRDQGARQMQALFLLKTREEINAYLGLVARLHGRRYAAWIPTWNDDFEMTRSVAANVRNRLYVKPNTYLDLTVFSDPAVALFVRLLDGTCYAVRVLNVAIGSTEATLVLDRNFGAAFSMDQVAMVSLLYRVRQVSDTSTIEWVTDSVARATVSFVSVFDET